MIFNVNDDSNVNFDTAFNLLARSADAGVFPGAVAAIGHSDGLLRVGAYGSRCLVPEKLPVLPDTLYDLASLTKVVATTPLFLVFQEKGWLSAMDKVSYYIDGFDEGNKKHITLLNLLTHTSGMKAHVRLDQICRDRRDAVRYITELQLLHDPGERVVYSCLGYILLGHILEKVGDDRLDALCKRYVFDPLDMHNTSFNPEPGNIAATEYDEKEGRPLVGLCHDENARFLGGVSGNAGLFSNIYDLAIFGQMLINNGLHKGRRFLSGASIKAMTRNYTSHLNEDRGLGWCIRGSRLGGMEEVYISAGDLMPPEAYGHTGFTGTSLWIDPEDDLFIILLSNRVHPSRDNTEFLRFRLLFHNAVMAGMEK